MTGPSSRARRVVHRLGSRAAGHLRHGPRTVLWTPLEGLGFGNVLYLWLHASLRQARGEEYRVLTPPPMTPWLAMLPAVRDRLTVDRARVRLTDRREHGWFSEFGTDFTREELQRFVREFLLGTPLLPRSGPADPGSVTLNVRRGDYYSQPHFRGTYGFDIPAYVEIALARAAAREPVERVLVVSDGLDWCRLKLDPLLRAHVTRVDYVSESDTPQENFRTVATSRRVIGTNSTFSYWAGYVADVLHGPRAHVVMPRFHARLREDPGAYQLDPAWDVVEDIPGGWDA